MRCDLLRVLCLAWGLLLLPGLSATPNHSSFSVFGQAISPRFAGLPATQPPDFWDAAKRMAESIKKYTETKLNEAATNVPLAAAKIVEFKTTMAQVVTTAGKLREEIENKAKERGLTLEQISASLSDDLQRVYEDFTGEFSGNLPEGGDDRTTERKKMVSWVMPKIENSVVKVTGPLGVEESSIRARFQEITPHVTHVILVVGNIIDRHPILMETVIFAVVTLLIPESWLLRPFLGMFGFGPYGPVKGSVAAWAQRRFWGAAVASGSWFSILQRAGMAGVGFWGKLLAKILAAAGLTAGVHAVVEG